MRRPGSQRMRPVASTREVRRSWPCSGGMREFYGVTGTAFRATSLQRELHPHIEEARFAGQVETIKLAETVRELEADVVGQVPVDHRCDATVAAAAQRAGIEVHVRVAQHELDGAGPALAHGD